MTRRPIYSLRIDRSNSPHILVLLLRKGCCKGSAPSNFLNHNIEFHHQVDDNLRASFQCVVIVCKAEDKRVPYRSLREEVRLTPGGGVNRIACSGLNGLTKSRSVWALTQTSSQNGRIIGQLTNICNNVPEWELQCQQRSSFLSLALNNLTGVQNALCIVYNRVCATLADAIWGILLCMIPSHSSSENSIPRSFSHALLMPSSLGKECLVPSLYKVDATFMPFVVIFSQIV